MGSVPTKRKPQPIFDMSQFQQIQANQCNYRSAYGVYTSYENRISKQQVDKYQLQFKQKKQQQNYYECFLHRFRQEYIVNTIQFIDFSHRQFCSSSFRAQVFIQHIPIRLGDITDIPYPDNIYILKNSLLGFQLLYSMIGYFQVQEDLICINNYGEVKVWLNSDLSKNYPDDYNEQLKSQCDMVQRILHLIESNTNIEQCPIQLGEYFIKKHKKYPNFTEALQLINLYTVQHKTAIPKFCQSVFQVFQESDQSKLKKQLALYEHSQSSYHQKSERRNTIQVNDILIPLLELPHIQQQKNLMQWPKKSKTMRDTVKILPSYTSDHQKKYSKQFKSLFFQNTQRLPTSVNRTLGYHTPQNQFLNYYNQLRTKRSPMILNSAYQVKTNPINNALNNDPYNLIHSMKQSMASSFLHVSQSKKYSHWPNVNFTYKSPSAILNMGHCTEFDLHQNKELSKKANQQWMKSKNSSKEDKFVNKTIKQKVKKQELDQIENKNFLYLHMTNINQIKKADLNNYEEKLQLVYYDTGKGSELIDPEIAADLLKYL